MKGIGVITLAALALIASPIGVLAQQTPLPEVRRQSSPAVAASAECNEPVTPDLRQPLPAPVVTAEQAPPRRAPEPSRETPGQPRGEVAQAEVIQPSRTELTAHESMAMLQQKASTGSYGEFVSALERARDKVAAMPSGSDKTAFTESLAAYAEVAEIWNYTMTDPMGAFYNDETLPGFYERIAKKHPGYAAFIRPQTLTDAAGKPLYPATETRQFLRGEAEKRLRGVRMPPPPGAPPVIAERETRPAPQVRREPTVPPARPREARPAQPSTTTRPTPPAPREAAPTVRREPVRREPVRREPVSREPVPAERREPQPVVPEPVTAAPAPATVAEPTETISTAPEPSTAAVAPPPQQPPRPRVVPPSEGRGLSTNTLLLIAFGVIALAAIALMARALRAKPVEPPSLITSEPAPPPAEEPLAADTEWLDPETRHWIEDANKTEKPPN